MNGRVYDSELGRFMSADPFVQAPYNSQSYNRYSYVFNNPLSFTDPSGYQSCGYSECNDTDTVDVIGTCPSGVTCLGADAGYQFGQDWQKQIDRSLTLFIEKSVDFIGVPTIFNATLETYIQVQNGEYSGALQTAAEGALEFGSKKIKTASNAAENAADLLKAAKEAEKKLEKALKNEKAISVDDALDKAISFLKVGVPVKSVDGKTGVQFIQEYMENGQRVTKRVGFDINPNSSHVQ